MRPWKRRASIVALALAAVGAAIVTGFLFVDLNRREIARRYNNRGVALMHATTFREPSETRRERHPSPIDEFEAALRVRPDYRVARLNAALAHFWKGPPDGYSRAEEILQAVLVEDPGNLRAHYALGRILEAREEYAAAGEHYAPVHAADSDDPCTLWRLGRCQENEGAILEAIATFERVQRRWPREAAWRLSWLHRKAGNADAAKAQMERFQHDRDKGLTWSGNLPMGSAGSISRMPFPVDRYLQPIPDPSDLAEKPPPEPSYVDATDRCGRTFRHAGASRDPRVRAVLDGEAVEREWFESAENRETLIESVGSGCGIADFDCDGRLDFFLANVDGRHALYAQAKTGTFRDVTAIAGIGGAPQRGMACVWGDYDDDGFPDLFIAGYGDARLYRNRNGRFEDVTSAVGIADSIDADTWCTGAVFADIDHDGDLDLYVTCLVDLSKAASKRLLRFPADFAGQANLLFRNNRDGGFREISSDIFASVPLSGHGSGTAALARPGGSRGAWFCDLDGDRVVELVTVDLAGKATAFLNRLDGTFLASGASVSTVTPAPPVGESHAYGDLDGDGGPDKLVNRNGEAARLLRNASPSKNWLIVRPRPYPRSDRTDGENRRCIGARVEVRAGGLSMHRDLNAGNFAFGCDAPEVHFDLGRMNRLEWVRVTFPSGARTTVPDVTANRVLTVDERDLELGSCPLLFSWNGERFEFISDAISAGIIGELIAPVLYWQPDPDEWVRIRDDQLRERGGSFELRFVNALQEVVYLDGARLVVADHPAGLGVYPNERMVADPANREPGKLFVLDHLRPVAHAADHRGRDVTETLEHVDRRHFDDFRLLPFKGFAEDWSLTLDLGERRADVLLLHGWTSWNSSASAIAARQAGKTAFGPVLEAMTAAASDGPEPEGSPSRWRLLTDDLGVPAGRPRTMLFDLRGLLWAGERVVRLRSNRTVYLDRVLVGEVVETSASLPGRSSSNLRLTEASLDAGDLRFLGYPRRLLPDGKAPATFDYHAIDERAEWSTPTGLFTRFGDVTPLLGAVDDRFVVMRHGDEVALSFGAETLPALPPGWRRTFFLYLDGYEKGMDVHGAHPQTVEPLPFHDMPSYPYPEEAYRLDSSQLDYVLDWNTRQEGLHPAGPKQTFQ